MTLMGQDMLTGLTNSAVARAANNISTEKNKVCVRRQFRPDDAYGRPVVADATKFVEQTGGRVTGTSFLPLPDTTDFSASGIRAQGSGANVAAFAAGWTTLRRPRRHSGRSARVGVRWSKPDRADQGCIRTHRQVENDIVSN
jgi:hypothetical protein